MKFLAFVVVKSKFVGMYPLSLYTLKFEFRGEARRGHLYLLKVISLCVVIKKLLHAFQLLSLALSEIVFVS